METQGFDYIVVGAGPGRVVIANRPSADQKHPLSVLERQGARPRPSRRSVVREDQLRVRGIEGLRVADASIMAMLTSGNNNARRL